ncbi:hypothetical protein C5167_029743 [Papaver somniferum]|nr:hypothetical protein C5167_029743 [Papaver somniferum]
MLLSSIFIGLIGVSTLRQQVHQSPPCYRNDGKVNLLGSSSNGSQIYLVGTNHIEQTKKEIEEPRNWRPGGTSPAGRWHHLRRVAIEECLQQKEKLIPIDRQLEDFHIFIPWEIHLQRVLNKEKSNAHLMDDGSRSYVREITRVERMLVPGHRGVYVYNASKDGRETYSGSGWDGIELLWKRAEDADDDKLLLATSETAGLQTGLLAAALGIYKLSPVFQDRLTVFTTDYTNEAAPSDDDVEEIKELAKVH